MEKHRFFRHGRMMQKDMVSPMSLMLSLGFFSDWMHGFLDGGCRWGALSQLVSDVYPMTDPWCWYKSIEIVDIPIKNGDFP